MPNFDFYVRGDSERAGSQGALYLTQYPAVFMTVTITARIKEPAQ